MKTFFFSGLIISILSCQNPTNNSSVVNTTSNYQKAKMTIEQQENSNPLAYLKISGTYKKNLLGTWVIEGNITSTATVANYKDVVITVNYYTKTNTLLGTQDFQQYEFIKPNSSTPFKIKSNGYRDTKSINIDIKSASIAN